MRNSAGFCDERRHRPATSAASSRAAFRQPRRILPHSGVSVETDLTPFGSNSCTSHSRSENREKTLKFSSFAGPVQRRHNRDPLMRAKSAVFRLAGSSRVTWPANFDEIFVQSGRRLSSQGPRASDLRPQIGTEVRGGHGVLRLVSANEVSIAGVAVPDSGWRALKSGVPG